MMLFPLVSLEVKFYWCFVFVLSSLRSTLRARFLSLGWIKISRQVRKLKTTTNRGIYTWTCFPWIQSSATVTCGQPCPSRLISFVSFLFLCFFFLCSGKFFLGVLFAFFRESQTKIKIKKSWLPQGVGITKEGMNNHLETFGSVSVVFSKGRCVNRREGGFQSVNKAELAEQEQEGQAVWANTFGNMMAT